MAIFEKKGLANSNYWGDLSPSMSMVVTALIRHENMYGTIGQSVKGLTIANFSLNKMTVNMNTRLNVT